MSQVSLIINVSDYEYVHYNGLSGIYRVPPKEPDTQFGLLVVYDRMEVQDLGEMRFTQNKQWAESGMVALSILGKGSESGPREKWGLLLCAATPEIPTELEKAIKDEITYLNRHLPQARYVKDADTGAAVLETTEAADVSKQKQHLSEQVQTLRAKFEADCRKHVTSAEIATAKRNLQIEDQRLLSDGDLIWAGPEPGRVNVSEAHKKACIRLGQERVWCYVPRQLVPCPGCAGMIPENVITCQHCGGILDAEYAEYATMSQMEKSVRIYPQRYAEPVVAGPVGKKH